jgi:glycosyltransferase involved in cell wall biosynthesis
MNSLSVCLVVQNEQDNLPRVLQSALGIAEEIIVVDGGSTDRTAEVADALGARVFHRPFTNYAEQKNYAASLAANDWIFLLDADEELSGELKESVKRWKRETPRCDVYEVARLTWYLGAWIRHSGWYPDYQRRLYRRDRTQFAGIVHESLRFAGKPGRLAGNLLHFTVRSFEEHAAKVERYTTLAAEQLYGQGKRHWRGGAWLAPVWSIFQNFVLRGGFLDGYRGWLIARMAARGVHLKYRKLGRLAAQKGRSGARA